MLSVHTHFYQKLESDRRDEAADYMDACDVMSKKIVLIPIHIERGTHWCLVVSFLQKLHQVEIKKNIHTDCDVHIFFKEFYQVN